MISLSQTARRFIDRAVAESAGEARMSAWTAWSQSLDHAPPPYVAQIAINALSQLALRLEELLSAEGAIAAEEAAEIERDLAYIGDVEAQLTESLAGREAAYA